MKLVGAGQQQRRDYMFDASGVTGAAASLVLPQRMSTSFLAITNLSDTSQYFEFGSARATATITNGAVTAVTITNPGFNFTRPPVVRFLGGGPGPGMPPLNQGPVGSPFLGGGLPGYPAPSNVAQAHAVLAAGAVSSIVIDNPGSGYLIAPFVFMYDSDLDPYGCAAPSITQGLLLTPGTSLLFNGTACTTDPVAVFCTAAGKAYSCKWMD